MTERVTFSSDSLSLAGVVHLPPDLSPGERRPAFLVLHGFGGSKDGAGSIALCERLAEWGYVTMRFDFRGCGESEGERGRIICLDQVADTKNAVDYVASRPEVDPQRIALIGSSFGAAVAIYAAGEDRRVAAVISSGGWGDGARKFRGQHQTPEAWERFTNMLEEGKRHRERTGQSLMVPRFEIVPIPEHLRASILTSQSIDMFPAETAQSMYDFRADDLVGNISPRPLLLLHSASDSVTPTVESIELFKRAKQPVELHLMSDVDHAMFSENNVRVWSIVTQWLERFMPISAGVRI
jgi:dipeptidyl aminopeptidase/acylaminoacyl peptidase